MKAIRLLPLILASGILSASAFGGDANRSRFDLAKAYCRQHPADCSGPSEPEGSVRYERMDNITNDEYCNQFPEECPVAKIHIRRGGQGNQLREDEDSKTDLEQAKEDSGSNSAGGEE